jgi:hypothetical protein
MAQAKKVWQIVLAGSTNHPGTPRGLVLKKSNKSIPEVVMPDDNLTTAQCDELAEALFEEAAALPEGSKKENILHLAQSYRSLAIIKELLARKVNLSRAG